MLIMLAGLQSQPSDILEAANVDGATPFGIFRQLTLPHLRRYLELGALLGSIYIVQAFDAIDVMTGGGPGSTNVPYFVYQESIGGGFRYGSASAYAIVVVIFSIIIATFSLRVLSGPAEGRGAGMSASHASRDEARRRREPRRGRSGSGLLAWVVGAALDLPGRLDACSRASRPSRTRRRRRCTTGLSFSRYQRRQPLDPGNAVARRRRSRTRSSSCSSRRSS